MIVWGGFDGLNRLNTGGRYNPGTDSWTASSTTNAPTARNKHTAVWTGSEMIVWGGNVAFSDEVNTVGRYNPGTDSWTATSNTNAPTARSEHSAVWTDSEMIVWGDLITTFSTLAGHTTPVPILGGPPARPTHLPPDPSTRQSGLAVK
jgi:N-acetylneuraminic acid mutarotase